MAYKITKISKRAKIHRFVKSKRAGAAGGGSGGNPPPTSGQIFPRGTD